MTIFLRKAGTEFRPTIVQYAAKDNFTDLTEMKVVFLITNDKLIGKGYELVIKSGENQEAKVPGFELSK